MKTKSLLEKLISQCPSRSTPKTKTKTKKTLFKTNPPSNPKPLPPPDMDLLELPLPTMHEYAQSGIAIAVKAIQDFRENRMSHNRALIVLIEQDMFDVAMAIYADMLKRNLPRDCGTFNSVIDGLGKAGKMQDAIQLFDEMAEMGISPDSTSYTNLLNGFCKFHRMDEAFRFLGSFLKKGYRVSLNGYSCVIDGLFGAGRFEEACKCYNNFLKDDENISPDTKLHRIMIKGYTEAGKIDDAFAILTEMCSGSLVSSLDKYSYSILLKHLIDVGLWNRAQLLVKDYILERDCIFNSPIHAIMIGWLCKAGFVHEAEEIFDKMVAFGRFPAVMAFSAIEVHKARLRLKMRRLKMMEMERNTEGFERLRHGNKAIEMQCVLDLFNFDDE